MLLVDVVGVVEAGVVVVVPNRLVVVFVVPVVELVELVEPVPTPPTPTFPTGTFNEAPGIRNPFSGFGSTRGTWCAVPAVST